MRLQRTFPKTFWLTLASVDNWNSHSNALVSMPMSLVFSDGAWNWFAWIIRWHIRDPHMLHQHWCPTSFSAKFSSVLPLSLSTLLVRSYPNMGSHSMLCLWHSTFSFLPLSSLRHTFLYGSKHVPMDNSSWMMSLQLISWNYNSKWSPWITVRAHHLSQHTSLG